MATMSSWRKSAFESKFILASSAMTLPSPVEDQRVDFGQAGIGFPECLVQALQLHARLGDAGFGNADLPGHVVGLGVGQALGGSTKTL